MKPACPHPAPWNPTALKLPGLTVTAIPARPHPWPCQRLTTPSPLALVTFGCHC